MEQQKYAVEGSEFTVSFTAPNTLRTFHRCRDGQLRIPAPVNVPASARADLRMDAQMHQSQTRATVNQARWVEANQASSVRLLEEEKHNLKILIKTAVLRQRDAHSTRLSSAILSRSSKQPQAVHCNSSATPSTKTKKKQKQPVTEAQAFDLDFVVKGLTRDIEIVYKRHGYAVTLQAFTELHPWQL